MVTMANLAYLWIDLLLESKGCGSLLTVLRDLGSSEIVLANCTNPFYLMITSSSLTCCLTNGGKGWGKCFTFALCLGLHTHIFKTKIFNRNLTFKSIELSEKDDFSCFLWIVGGSRYNCLLLPLKVLPSISSLVLGVAWAFSHLNPLNRLILG